MAKPTLALVPHLTHDELTILLSALAAQIREDKGLLEVAQSKEITGLAHERIKISRSLATAFLEARHQVSRYRGGPLEPLRVVWDQPETAMTMWS